MRRSLIIGVTYMLLFALNLIEVKNEACYGLHWLRREWKDARPRYIANYTFYEDGGIGADTTVNEEIPLPVSRTILIRRDGNGKYVTLYNTSTKICDSGSFINRIPIFKWVVDKITKQSNFSYTCPLKKGHYFLDKFKVEENNVMLRFFYRPKVAYFVIGGIMETLPDKSLDWLNRYELGARIIKKNCD